MAICLDVGAVYAGGVPKLWDETIETHRQAVRETTMATAVALVAEHGLASVTMSQIAKEAGIGRATLYKYFSDVESILLAWHEQHVRRHLEHLAQVRDRHDAPWARLEAVLRAYAHLTHERPHDTDLARLVHRDDHAQHHLVALVRDLLAQAAGSGDVRGDVPEEELAAYCLHALDAARDLRSEAAVDRLTAVTLSALRGN